MHMVIKLIEYMEVHDYISWYINENVSMRDSILLYSLIEMIHNEVNEKLYNECKQSSLYTSVCIVTRNRLEELITEGYFEEEEE